MNWLFSISFWYHRTSSRGKLPSSKFKVALDPEPLKENSSLCSSALGFKRWNPNSEPRTELKKFEPNFLRNCDQEIEKVFAVNLLQSTSNTEPLTADFFQLIVPLIMQLGLAKSFKSEFPKQTELEKWKFSSASFNQAGLLIIAETAYYVGHIVGHSNCRSFSIRFSQIWRSKSDETDKLFALNMVTVFHSKMNSIIF